MCSTHLLPLLTNLPPSLSHPACSPTGTYCTAGASAPSLCAAGYYGTTPGSTVGVQVAREAFKFNLGGYGLLFS